MILMNNYYCIFLPILFNIYFIRTATVQGNNIRNEEENFDYQIHFTLVLHFIEKTVICSTNERTGFYMICNTVLKWVNIIKITILVVNYVFKVKNRNTRIRCKICLKLTIKPMASLWCLYC